MKTFLYFLGAIAISILLFMGGCRTLTKHIFQRQDCARFNIDNIELRTGIDIPATKSANYECAPGSKDAEFTLNLKPEEIDDYITRNKFILKDGLYVNTNENEYTKWYAVLDLSTQNLKIHLDYIK